MNRVLHLVALLLISVNLFAQAPQRMSYQAVIRNASNNLITNAPVRMRISILQGGTNGTSVYSELHNPTTNANGLATIEIGAGTSPQGIFSAINWGNGTYFLRTETDPSNGTNYSIVGTSQLLSVPYALHSGNGIRGVSSSGDTLFLDNGKKIIIPGISNANPSVTDISGNTYPIITLGTQTWMAENLRTTKFNDGTNIPVVTDNGQWANNFNNNSTQPMMCWYNNDELTFTNNKFGALYNWYVISPITNGNKNVCPAGWHVPSDIEWTTLTTFLGGDLIAGGKMKSTGTKYWVTPNTDATNSSGFSGFPGGSRNANGIFGGIFNNGNWWSSTEQDIPYAFIRVIRSDAGAIFKGIDDKGDGFSIRCIKD